MTTRLTIRVASDVTEAINELLRREPGGTTINYVISKAVIEYAKSVTRDADKHHMTQEERLAKWTRKRDDNDYSDS